MSDAILAFAIGAPVVAALVALRKLLEAKDAAVRALLAKDVAS